MRPKKKVLLYCQDGLTLSSISFVLWSRGYNVTTCNSEISAMEALDTWTGDCAIILQRTIGPEDDNCKVLIDEIKARLPEVKVGLNLSKTTLILTKADVVVRLATNEGLMQMVRDLCVHKRGPKTTGIVHLEEVPA